MDKKNNNVNDFWKNYRNIVVAEGVPEATAGSYLRWARRFAVSIKWQAGSLYPSGEPFNLIYNLIPIKGGETPIPVYYPAIYDDISDVGSGCRVYKL